MNNFYKFMQSALLAFVFSAVAMAQNAPADMDMDAHTWCQNVKAGWNLGNALESSDGSWDNSTWKYSGKSDPNTWETKWGNPATTKAMIKAVKDAGFNAIRIPVLWYPHVKNYETMEVDQKWMNRVKEVVDWCLEEDMYVMINTHHERWLEMNPTYAQKDKINGMLSKLWVNIANAFADYDKRVTFAGTNETTVNWAAPTAEHQAVQNSYNQTFVDAVRSTGGKNMYRNLIVQTYACSPYHGRTGLTVPTDKVEGRLSVEFHYYDPYNYCSGNTGKDYYYYWGTEYKNKGYSTPNDNENTIKNLFSGLKTRWYDKGLGVIVGEYGVSAHYPADGKDVQHENMQYYLKTLVGYIRQYGFAGFVWDNNSFGNGSEKFGVFDRRNNMNIRAPYLYKGIMEGAGIDYDPEIGGGGNTGGNTEYGDAATVLWQGEADLAWGDGFQYNMPSSDFATLKTSDKLVFKCKVKAMKENYNMIQIFYGDWSTNPSFSVNGNPTEKQFVVTDYCSDPDDMAVELTFDQATINIIKQKGLVLQGYGLTLTEVLLVDGNKTGITEVSNSNKSGIIYNIQGMRVAQPRHGEIIISNGKKVLYTK